MRGRYAGRTLQWRHMSVKASQSQRQLDDFWTVEANYEEKLIGNAYYWAFVRGIHG